MKTMWVWAKPYHLRSFPAPGAPGAVEQGEQSEEGVRIPGVSEGCRSRPAMSRSNCDCHVDGEERDWKISKLT